MCDLEGLPTDFAAFVLKIIKQSVATTNMRTGRSQSDDSLGVFAGSTSAGSRCLTPATHTHGIPHALAWLQWADLWPTACAAATWLSGIEACQLCMPVLAL